MTDILLLWHMHQPRYVHPRDGRHVLPWVRLHACAGYLDMGRALERHPGVRVTVNFVPSLVEQLEDLLAGQKDDLERIAEKHADELDESEQRAVLERCFSVRWDRAIAPRPRYAQLLAERGKRRYGPAELRDLQCLFLIAWLGFAAREDDPAIDAMDRKGRDYSEDDKRALLRAVRAAASRVLPTWRKLAQSGQVELSTSPYYHPIVPLLIDSDVALRSRPGDLLPRRFCRPQDAREHVQRACVAHARAFGVQAKGMWPPEGSLSPEAVDLYRECGIKWLAGDEETLARSLDGCAATSHGPLGAGTSGKWTAARTRAWRFAGVDLVFRDRDLSDRIGFRYSSWPAQDAASEIIGAARSLGERGEIVGLFLDGENAWESFPRRGEEFLEALYGSLEREAEASLLVPRTISESLAERGPGQELTHLHSGSWIDASFRVWIGDPDKNRAWKQLDRARERLAAAEATHGSTAFTERARNLLFIAEGSDWFWWFGEPFSSAEDAVFDELFRAHLQEAWRALGDMPPEELLEPIERSRLAALAAPKALLKPRLDGKADRFFEWVGAARHDVGRGSTMAGSEHPVDKLYLGFDHHNMYLRLDPTRDNRRRIAASRMVLKACIAGRDEWRLLVQVGAPDGGAELSAIGGKIAALDVVELAVPFVSLGAKPRDEIRLWMTLEFAGVTFARIPRDGLLSITVPWPGWEDEHWSA
ncbi:MAG: glycoside hydrolase [Deltaproteobacteria bacterium]|nr:glycoside hydrolase [Deltaproteobacteria bacterium]